MEKCNYPKWHLRFTRAQNLLAKAVAEMEQAYFEERGNEEFRSLDLNMHVMLDQVVGQQRSNIERGRKEGWLK